VKADASVAVLPVPDPFGDHFEGASQTTAREVDRGGFAMARDGAGLHDAQSGSAGAQNALQNMQVILVELTGLEPVTPTLPGCNGVCWPVRGCLMPLEPCRSAERLRAHASSACSRLTESLRTPLGHAEQSSLVDSQIDTRPAPCRN
jgi:hypothetical protein